MKSLTDYQLKPPKEKEKKIQPNKGTKLGLIAIF